MPWCCSCFQCIVSLLLSSWLTFPLFFQVLYFHKGLFRVFFFFFQMNWTGAGEEQHVWLSICLIDHWFLPHRPIFISGVDFSHLKWTNKVCMSLTKVLCLSALLITFYHYYLLYWFHFTPETCLALGSFFFFYSCELIILLYH